jgi:hypothetical protein
LIKNPGKSALTPGFLCSARCAKNLVFHAHTWVFNLNYFFKLFPMLKNVQNFMVKSKFSKKKSFYCFFLFTSSFYSNVVTCI